jgi:hypothetical protein
MSGTVLDAQTQLEVVMEALMPTGPLRKEKKPMLAVRIPADLDAWLHSLANPKEGVTHTDAVAWALAVGRDFAEATRAHQAWLDELARAEGLTQAGAIRRVFEAGVSTLKKSRR